MADFPYEIIFNVIIILMLFVLSYQLGTIIDYCKYFVKRAKDKDNNDTDQPPEE